MVVAAAAVEIAESDVVVSAVDIATVAFLQAVSVPEQGQRAVTVCSNGRRGNCAEKQQSCSHYAMPITNLL